MVIPSQSFPTKIPYGWGREGEKEMERERERERREREKANVDARMPACTNVRAGVECECLIYNKS